MAVEPDPVLVKLAKLNFSLLGVENIEVIESKAEDFHSREKFDLIYADPSRRDANNQRNFLPEQGSPNLPALMPALLKMSDRILVKNSPLLDVSAASKYPFIRHVSVLGTDGECKEILLEFGNNTLEPPGKSSAYYFKGEPFHFSPSDKSALIKPSFPASGYILEADVCIYKAGLAPEFFGETNLEGWMQSPQGYFFANEVPANFPVKVFKIIRQIPFKPATWKKELAKNGIEKILLTKRELRVPLEQIRKEMKLKEGGENYLVLTGKSAYLCERIY